MIENKPFISGSEDFKGKFCACGANRPPTLVPLKAKTQFWSEKRPVAKVLGILPVCNFTQRILSPQSIL